MVLKNFYSLENEAIDLMKMSDRFLQDSNSIFHQATVTYNKMKSNNNNCNKKKTNSNNNSSNNNNNNKLPG